MRKLLGVLVAALAATTLGSFTPVGAQAVMARLTVTGSPVRAGESFQVSSSNCSGGSTVMVGMLDADSESALASAAVTPDEGGDWVATLTVPASTRPGTYPVTARCTDYSGYGGYNGYNGYNGSDGDGPPDGYNGAYVGAPGAGTTYLSGHVVVLPPSSPPASDGPLRVTPDVVERGGTVRITGGGWAAGEQITVTLYSTPVVLASVRADASGAISVQTTIAADTELGAHTVVAMNASSALHPARTLSGKLTVIERLAGVTTTTVVTGTTAPRAEHLGATTERGSSSPSSLPFTGAGIVWAVAFGALLLAAGEVLRRRARSSRGT